jgi:hypothetical protein
MSSWCGAQLLKAQGNFTFTLSWTLMEGLQSKEKILLLDGILQTLCRKEWLHQDYVYTYQQRYRANKEGS